MNWISLSSIRRFLIAASLALGVPMMVVAGPRLMHDSEFAGPEHHGAPGGELAPPYLPALKLDEAQRDKVFAILHGQAPGLRERLKNLGRAENDLHRLTAAPDYDETRAKALADQVGRATAEIALLRARTDRQIFDVLTPEQRKRLAESGPDGGARPGPGCGPQGPGADAPGRPPR